MKVLFVSYGAGHIEMCLPVIKALRQAQPRLDVQLMALTTAHAAARRAGEAALGFRDFCRRPEDDRAFAFGERLLPGNEHPDVTRDESVAYLGQNFMEWVEDLGEQGAFERWRAVGRQGFLPVRFFRRVLREVRPDVVVTTNSPRSEQAAVAAAAELGIASLSMLDLFALPGDPFARRPVASDRITVLSEVARSNLVTAGVAGDRIAVTGNPAFDALTGPQAVADVLAWRHARGWAGKHIVLWAGHLEPRDAEPAQWAGSGLGQAVQERLVQWVASRDDVCLAVRYHPNEWHSFEPPKPHPRMHWSEPGQEGLLPVLLAADQVVVQATTVGAQAHAAGKQVIGLGFSPLVRRTGMDYASLGMGHRAENLDGLVELLSSGFQQPVSGPPAAAGHAAAAVAAEIMALAARSRRYP